MAAVYAEGHNAAALKKMGFDVYTLRWTVGFSVSQLRAAGFEAKTLAEAGLGAHELFTAGYELSTLKAAGYVAKDLKAAGFDAVELHRVGYSLPKLKNAGFHPCALHATGCSSAELRRLYDVPQDARATLTLVSRSHRHPNSPFYGLPAARTLEAFGFNASALKSAGLDAATLGQVGFDVLTMARAGFSSARELKDAGFGPAALLDAGIDETEVAAAGFDPISLRAAGIVDTSSARDERMRGAAAPESQGAAVETMTLDALLMVDEDDNDEPSIDAPPTRTQRSSMLRLNTLKGIR